MSQYTLTKTRLRAGIWEGVITGASTAPDIAVYHLEQPLANVRLVAGEGGDYVLSVPIPAKLLNDGLQTFVIKDKSNDATLESFAILAGSALDHDLRSELDLLRAELDLLKRAFRRHCVETA